MKRWRQHEFIHEGARRVTKTCYQSLRDSSCAFVDERWTKTRKTLIKNGHIVTAVDSYIADILIDGETVAMIGKDLSSIVGSVDKTIDATGKLVIPGGVDPHTHMDLPFGGTSSS